ncbi:MAG TPA: acyl-CoA dehydrogenase C-terminal domain-containing protein, partial [Casimicrobiaceae bacterium]|nr:acyl-CoA dehydrogenase C-terminal domain-containing protein [Casimicrobiaceae bacterium]
ATELSKAADADLKRIGAELLTAAQALSGVVDWVVASYGDKPRAAHAAAVPYLKLWGLVAGAWQMARAAQIASQRLAQGKGDAKFYRGKIATARFYAESILPQASALARSIAGGSEAVLALADEQF